MMENSVILIICELLVMVMISVSNCLDPMVWCRAEIGNCMRCSGFLVVIWRLLNFIFIFLSNVIIRCTWWRLWSLLM